jgi:hypothetical protein
VFVCVYALVLVLLVMSLCDLLMWTGGGAIMLMICGCLVLYVVMLYVVVTCMCYNNERDHSSCREIGRELTQRHNVQQGMGITSADHAPEEKRSNNKKVI